MLIQEIMTRGVECICPDMTIQEAAQKMRDLDVGPLPVCGRNDRLEGMITDRDIAVRAVAAGKDPSTTPVSEIMTRKILYCFEDQDVADAANLMQSEQVRRLAVLNRDKRLVGIVSLGDVAVTARSEGLAGEAIEAISEPVHA